MTVTVYTKPACVQCDRTKKMLDRLVILYVTIDVTQDENAYTRLVADGLLSMPVVSADGYEPWSGFRPDHIRALNALIKEN